jgi:FHS family L-fucose permease-like MFS transporter
MAHFGGTAPAGSTSIEGGGELRGFVFALFFIFGGLTSLNDVLIPKLKHLFSLSYTEVMLVQSAFFIGYLVVSIPAGFLVTRLGYMRSAVVGLLTMALGCLLFLPAAHSAQFIAFLGALFILAAGITIVQVVANPLISILGAPATASSRLTFAQAFNSLGTTVFPWVGAVLILGSIATVDEKALNPAALAAFRAKEAAVVSDTYIGLAVALSLIAAVVWLMRNRLRESRLEATNPLDALDLLKRKRFAFGMLCIFLYVGAEVAIGSLLSNYLMQSQTLALDAQSAGKHLAFYWGGAMIGRFIGAALLRTFPPGKVLASAALTALVLLCVSISTVGLVSGWALLAVGLFNSIMFPTIFSLANEGLGKRTAEGSGLICVAIVGGALIPPLTGYVADLGSLGIALIVPAVCYVIIASFGWYARRPTPEIDREEGETCR